MQSVSFCHRLSKKLNFIKIWQLKVGQNKDLVCYRKKLSLRKCAWGPRQLVLKPGFKLKGGLWVCRKSQKISTASDQYFLSYLKKNFRVQTDPPPAGIGLKDYKRTFKIWMPEFATVPLKPIYFVKNEEDCRFSRFKSISVW